MTVFPAELIDTHCHLTSEPLGDDPFGHWERARAAGVVAALVVGINAPACREVMALVEPTPGLYAILGIHPNDTSVATEEDFAAILDLAKHEKVVALGETGLDYYWKDSSPEVQGYWLDRHVEAALKLDLPLVLHIRDAYEEAARRLAEPARRGLRGVVHCFAGAEHEVVPFVEFGWPISFSGILTYGKAENVRAAARRTPLSQCLVETDAPWLTPLPERGRPNEPAFVGHTARCLAEVKELSFEEVANTTTANARRIFGLATP